MLASRIALRYLFAKKSHKAVNVISVISMAGVAVATMAIVVVLSVFNGFTDLASRHLSLIDPDVKILPATGKVFHAADSLRSIVETHPDVEAAMITIQERGLLTAGEIQKPVVFKGIDAAEAPEVLDMEGLIIDGSFEDGTNIPGNISGAQIAVGVALDMSLRPSMYRAAELYVPRRTGRINPANPAAAYYTLPLAVTGVFRVDQPEYDSDFIFIPLSDARDILEYGGEDVAGAIEIRTKAGTDAERLSSELQRQLGDGFQVLTREQQQAETFRMIAVEKWVTFLMLVFILLVASFNIISTLSLLVIEKRDNMETLRALGAQRSLVRNIFIVEGWLITIFGGIIGTATGILLSLAQQHFGIIKLAADTSALTIDVYPVRLEWGDVALVLAAVVLTGFAIAQISRFFTRKIQ